VTLGKNRPAGYAVVLAAALSASLAAGPAEGRRRGIVGRKAPALAVSQWFNLPAGEKSVDVADYAGKVVYLFFFQSW